MRGIYRLVHIMNHEKFYIGSSQDIVKRFRKHKNNCKKETFNCTLYRELRADGVENYCLEILEEIPKDAVVTQMELLEKEQHYIKELKPPLNTRAAYLTAEEKYAQQKAAWTKRNQTKVKCECGVVSGKAHIARHKKTKRHRVKMIEIKTKELIELYNSFGIAGGFGFCVADLPVADEEPPTDVTFLTPTVLDTSNNEAQTP